MVYCFVHLLDEPDPADGEEEVYVVVPGTSKVAMAIPLDALPQFLTLLEQVLRETPMRLCPVCAAPMASVAVCSSPQREPPQTG